MRSRHTYKCYKLEARLTDDCSYKSLTIGQDSLGVASILTKEWVGIPVKIVLDENITTGISCPVAELYGFMDYFSAKKLQYEFFKEFDC